ncbi:SIR2 family NAD-dependent protein deacylase [Aerococcus kribbianus]|uniref:Deacetylase SIR2 n=1 Tax=Aerococcus kribbianus TaxID=2999064 RepID=A0A9X3JGD1_9LACT|nr:MULTISPECIES: deacetylase SIR2 [unclassified Aerococcus]MCZ0717111.1 deacetylase SIR2 [Aerococcus sp. YH-aer221]MCZ0725399.1 deacetylase SIR2 [Aerococcus sp. YH-aer222]
MQESKPWMVLNQNAESQSQQLAKAIAEAEAIVVGVGAGMSAATGFTYVGPRFKNAFPDFIEKYNFYDMLQAFLADFEDAQEYWAFQSRFSLLNYFDQPQGQAYVDLKEILADKNYHVITTNADNAFYAADFDMDKVFRIQGEYGLWQCSAMCHQETYQDEDLIRKMVAQQENMRIPAELVPHCPHCGAVFEINKRDAQKGMVEDKDWHDQNDRYQVFLKENAGKKILYLEIGVGMTTPQFIRHPFQKWTAENPNALYITMNQKPYRIASDIQDQSLRLTDDIAQCLHAIV